MEIDVTSYFKTTEHCMVSGSRAELGNDAGKITWANAMAEAENLPFLKSEAEFGAARTHFEEYGAWSEEEIATWTPQELNAMVAQEVSNAAREGGLDGGEPSDADWIDYETRSEAGQCSSNLFKGNDGKVYFYLGS